MPDLLLELFSEEIPARMQMRARADLRRLVVDGLNDAGLSYEDAKAFSTPRRLALAVEGVALRSPDTREERKGPRVGAPDRAVEGFLRAAGLSSLDQCETRDDGKGAYHVAVIEQPGRAATQIIAEVVEKAVRGFPWAKSMRWGDGQLRWVRPLHSILATFGAKTETPEVVKLSIDGIEAGNVTRGHRMMAPGEITVSRFDDYVTKLEAAKVEIDAEHRRETILADAKSLALAQGLELIDDPALADEVAGLVEWPVTLIGTFDIAFLELPAEVLATTMRVNQKYFVLKNAKTGEIANRFIVVANIEAGDGGAAIIAGNERVLSARLHDARFFWEQDLKSGLEEHGAKLADVVFHEKLGSQAERVERIADLARELAPLVGADADQAERAARLAKADLMSGMVGEFPELQGVMGRYYALKQGEPEAVAGAIGDHYRPQGPSDEVSKDPVSIAVALADKLDMLVGFWAIDEKPTGSKDPFALRRAALGVIRIVLENELRIRLLTLIREHAPRLAHVEGDEAYIWGLDQSDRLSRSDEGVVISPQTELPELTGLSTDLLSFFADRLKVHLREAGARHDLIDAVFSLGDQDDLLMIVRRVEALGDFLGTDDGANLLAGVKRAQNILQIEEKKDGEGAFDGDPDAKLFAEPAERQLFEAIGAASGEGEAAVKLEDFADAMRALAKLRGPVDEFFDDVTVNADDPSLRANRLKLLNLIRRATLAIADFSRIEG